MIKPEYFIEKLRKNGIDCFAGVPDSLLKNICAYITDHCDSQHNIIESNEGAAVGLAAGHYLATGHPACVYMQNSGEGNIINPLASLTAPEVYNIPVLLLIGWRGRPGVHDEPQHVKQGKVTTGLLNTMGINFDVLSKEEDKAEKQIEKAIQTVTAALSEKDCIVSTTGMISRELFEYRALMNQGHERDFLTVGSMGHASQIALGIAMAQPNRRVWCFDGDGASIMHMGSMAIVASKEPKNYVHVVFNNGAHDSVGGQPTVGLKINIPAVALAVGYRKAFSVKSKEELAETLKIIESNYGPILLEVKVKKGNRKDLGRPTTTPIENKEALMQFLKK